MLLDVAEVQITSIIIMGLITLFLVFILPTYTSEERNYNHARKILSGSTFLVMLHFIVQYLLGKQAENIAITRSIINLLFGIPISYLCNMSYIYIQQAGKISLHDWLFAPLILLIQGAVLFITWNVSNNDTEMQLSTYIMSMLYATTLFYYAYLILCGHRRLLANIKDGKFQHLIPFVKYTHWSFILLVLLAFGFPLMTFNTNMLMRSLYGILSISVFFFYIISFAIYGIKGSIPRAASGILKEDTEEEKALLNAVKLERINTAVAALTKNDTYTRSSLTLKEAADAMGVSVNMLKIWLRHSEYEKYNNWITSLRVSKAKELMLEDPDISYDDLSEKCGFCDRQYFYRQFKKHEGVSPAVWIKEQLETR